MWILWDNSYSVGKSSFVDRVKPFLKGLINSPELDVGLHGTQIGIITFSTQVRTKVLVELGAMKTAGELNDYIDALNWEDVTGDGTRTGMAFKMATEVRL